MHHLHGAMLYRQGPLSNFYKIRYGEGVPGP